MACPDVLEFIGLSKKQTDGAVDGLAAFFPRTDIDQTENGPGPDSAVSPSDGPRKCYSIFNDMYSAVASDLSALVSKRIDMACDTQINERNNKIHTCILVLQ
jgi:hypothetical protein